MAAAVTSPPTRLRSASSVSPPTVHARVDVTVADLLRAQHLTIETQARTIEQLRHDRSEDARKIVQMATERDEMRQEVAQSRREITDLRSSDLVNAGVLASNKKLGRAITVVQVVIIVISVILVCL